MLYPSITLPVCPFIHPLITYSSMTSLSISHLFAHFFIIYLSICVSLHPSIIYPFILFSSHPGVFFPFPPLLQSSVRLPIHLFVICLLCLFICLFIIQPFLHPSGPSLFLAVWFLQAPYWKRESECVFINFCWSFLCLSFGLKWFENSRNMRLEKCGTLT